MRKPGRLKELTEMMYSKAQVSWLRRATTITSNCPVTFSDDCREEVAAKAETRWVGSRARDADGYKLWYSGITKGKNGVGILVDKELLESVVEVSIPLVERLFIGGDFNGHIGSTFDGHGVVQGGFGFGVRNGGGTSLLDFAEVFELAISNFSFPKREEHLVTFQSTVARTQVDYILLRRYDRGLCKDCKVIPRETLATQHRLLVMDVGIVIKRKKRSARGRPRIR
nr:craniofacial development protein 2-like [Nicotiana tomentosiformis]